MMKILWFNWKDIKHPEAGGAEVYTHEIAKRIVKNGHEVTFFTSEFQNGEKEDQIDEVKIIRRGKRFNVLNSIYRNAKKFYERHGNRYDAVVGEIDTRPFLTPKFVRKLIIALIHQLACELWDCSITGKLIEKPTELYRLLGESFIRNMSCLMKF